MTGAASTSRTRCTRAGTRQFYPAGLDGWIAKLDVGPEGGLELDPEFLTTNFDGRLPHQIRLEGGDASSDSYCFS